MHHAHVVSLSSNLSALPHAIWALYEQTSIQAYLFPDLTWWRLRICVASRSRLAIILLTLYTCLRLQCRWLERTSSFNFRDPSTALQQSCSRSHGYWINLERVWKPRFLLRKIHNLTIPHLSDIVQIARCGGIFRSSSSLYLLPASSLRGAEYSVAVQHRLHFSFQSQNQNALVKNVVLLFVLNFLVCSLFTLI